MWRYAAATWLFWAALAQAEEAPLTPASACAAASADAARLGKAAAHVRYLSLYAVPVKDRQKWARLVSFVVNSFSAEPDIAPPTLLADGVTLRLDLEDYGIDPKVWERLADHDVFFHVRLEQGGGRRAAQLVDTGQVGAVSDRVGELVLETTADAVVTVDNRPTDSTGSRRRFVTGTLTGPRTIRLTVTQGGVTATANVTLVPGRSTTWRFTAGQGRVTARTALAPWLAETAEAKRQLAALVELTGSRAPVLRADWWVWEVFQATERNAQRPGYYQFLGVKDQKTFEARIGYDAKQSAAFTRELLASVANSGVSRQPRRISREEKIGGSYWRTYDNKAALDDRNPLRVLNGGFRFDATEAFGSLPNGLWAVALFDNKGVLQDSAPDFVGHDKTTSSNDGRIINGVSCFRCHADGGLQPIRDWARNLLRPPLALQSVDYGELKRLRQRYLRRLEPYLDDDRARFARSVKECNGLTPKANARNLARRWEEVADTPVSLERAARELGVTPKQFTAALDRYLKASGKIDTVLAIYLRPAEEQEGIPWEQWQEAYPLAQLAIRGYGTTVK